jgi:cytochrome c oxidase cbb3-type subunit 2
MPAALFWVLAIALFVVPFLSAPEAPDWGGNTDPRSRANWEDPQSPFNPKDLPFWEQVEVAEEELDGKLEQSLRTFIEHESEAFYGPESPHLRSAGVIEVRRLAAGRETYLAECAGCHGADLEPGTAPGDGAGPAARFMHPRPRNFRKGFFKFTSTNSGERPLRKDLYRTVSYGLAGASMPHFKLLTEERRNDVIEYVRYLALRGEFEELLLSFTLEEEELAEPTEVAELVDEWWDERNLESVFPSSGEPPPTPESIANGRRLYMDAQGAGCVGCHGETGVGDGPSAKAFLDSWGYPIKPRDFTDGVYRAGGTNTDLWVTIATGINGTPMGSFSSSLTSEEIWNIVHFVRSLERSQGGN